MLSNRMFRLRINTGLIFWDFPVTQMVKILPAMQENWVQSIHQEDPPEKEMAWRIPWTEEPGGLQSMGSQRLRQDCATNTYILAYSSLIQKRHILSISCLGN